VVVVLWSRSIEIGIYGTVEGAIESTMISFYGTG
jgi:hypothetical protein